MVISQNKTNQKPLHILERTELFFFLNANCSESLQNPVSQLVARGVEPANRHGATLRMCHAVLQLQSLPSAAVDNLHWTQARIPRRCHTVGTFCNCNSSPAVHLARMGQPMWTECICVTSVIFPHFKSLSAKCVAVKSSILIHIKISTEFYFCPGMFKWSKFKMKFKRNFVADLNSCWFSFQCAKRCCSCQECKPSCSLLYTRVSAFYCASFRFEVHFNGDHNRCNFDVR